MKKSMLILLLTLLTLSCNKDEDDVIISKESTEYIVHENASLKVSYSDFGTFVEIVEGDKLVFEYTFTEASTPEIADSGYNEYLYFEMPAGTEDFTITSAEFESSNTYLRRSCFCEVTDFRKVTSGVISAEKTGTMQWNISFEVGANYTVEDGDEDFSGSIEFEDSGIFQTQ